MWVVTLELRSTESVHEPGHSRITTAKIDILERALWSFFEQQFKRTRCIAFAWPCEWWTALEFLLCYMPRCRCRNLMVLISCYTQFTALHLRSNCIMFANDNNGTEEMRRSLSPDNHENISLQRIERSGNHLSQKQNKKHMNS